MIKANFPPEFLGAFSDDPRDLERTQRFCRLLAAEGLLALAWPVEYGGAGGSSWEQTVLREEMWAHHEPRGPQYMGINWVGPAVMRHGSDQQRQKHLPPIAAGEVIWCQGFSEPGAGSDLASLATKATRAADGWRINGQKIWTSYAQVAQWCVLAARTSADGPKQAGITVFLIPMDREGITVRPIASMLGPHHLNEVFFDNVQAGENEVLGGVGEGWKVMRAALAFERVGIARYARAERLLALAIEQMGIGTLPGSLRARVAKALVHLRIARLLAYRAIDAQARGNVSDREASGARMVATRTDQEVGDLLADLLGSGLLETGSDAFLYGAIEDFWRYSRAATVASGTLEVQQMLVSRALLSQGV
jgi:alkylation response protein AidB-like acyl-CoA dehydrogenase